MRQKLLLVAALASMAAWELYVEFFAGRAAIKVITAYHLDKIFHAIGGIFIAGVLYWMFGRQHIARVFFAVLLVSLAWEGAELVFDARTLYFFETERALWAEDSMGDVIIGMVGGWAYQLFLRPKKV